MDALSIPNMSITTVLVGYLVTQTIMAGIIYWLISRAARRKIYVLFGDAGRAAFFAGFNDAARDALAEIMKEAHGHLMQTAEMAVSTAKSLAVDTATDVDTINQKLHDIDRQLYELRLTFDKIDQMSNDMHDTNISITNLQSRLCEFFEQNNGNKS